MKWILMLMMVIAVGRGLAYEESDDEESCQVQGQLTEIKRGLDDVKQELLGIKPSCPTLVVPKPSYTIVSLGCCHFSKQLGKKVCKARVALEN